MADGNGNGNGKGALHQLLAVEPSLKGAASKILAETRKTFTGKQTHFHESQRRYVCSIENDPGFPDESSPMSTTVGEKLAHVAEVVGPFIDAGLQIDRTNQEAVADLAFGDKTIANIPSTALLRLDHRLGELRQIMDSIPTLDPNTSWTADSDMGKGIWKAEEEVKHRTTKEEGFEVVVNATDKHPAQYERVSKDVHHGTWTTRKWSGELSVSQKYEILKRLDTLQNAVKKAIAEANRREHSKAAIASDVFEFLFGDIALSR
jgi:hypothetical protein